MDRMQQMGVQNDTKDVGGSKLAYSSSTPAIKPLITSTGSFIIIFF